MVVADASKPDKVLLRQALSAVRHPRFGIDARGRVHKVLVLAIGWSLNSQSEGLTSLKRQREDLGSEGRIVLISAKHVDE